MDCVLGSTCGQLWGMTLSFCRLEGACGSHFPELSKWIRQQREARLTVYSELLFDIFHGAMNEIQLCSRHAGHVRRADLFHRPFEDSPMHLHHIIMFAAHI